MKPKTEADIDQLMKKLAEQKKKLVQHKKIAYAEGISKAIKAGHLDAKVINDALHRSVKSKKDRALLGLSGSQPESTATPPPLSANQ
ncbi:MAG: hypothetical protein ACPG47_00720 [Leucothrix sp.]